MTALVVAGGSGFGLLCAILGLRWRGKPAGLAVAYGIVGAGAVWAAAAVVAGNMADGMAGIGPLVVGASVFWFLVVPAGSYAVLAELRRARQGREPPDVTWPPTPRHDS